MYTYLSISRTLIPMLHANPLIQPSKITVWPRKSKIIITIRNERISKMGKNLSYSTFIKNYTYNNILFLILERIID
jgi:hypothetical protein